MKSRERVAVKELAKQLFQKVDSYKEREELLTGEGDCLHLKFKLC